MYRGFVKMVLDSGANGLTPWWSVGGYRVDEKSDFGCFSPNGTPRSSALEMKRRAQELASPRMRRPILKWVTVDRDLHAAGFDMVYAANKRAYVEAAKKGGNIGVRTAGTGTNSANCPLAAVGNVPYDGFSPLKFLNGEFNRLQVLNAAGAWQAVEDGDTVEVKAGAPLRMRGSVGNTGDADWIGADGRRKRASGAVRLVGDNRPDEADSGMPRVAIAIPLPAARRCQDIEIASTGPQITQDSEVVLTFEAVGRARFGERRRILLRVVDRTP